MRLAELLPTAIITVLVGCGAIAAAEWQDPHWHVVPSSGGAMKRPAPIRSIVRTSAGRLLGTRPAGRAVELWASDNNGVDWQRRGDVATTATGIFGDSTLKVLPSGEILVGYREHSETLGWRVRLSLSTDDGATWSPGGVIHDWTMHADEFVGAPFFNLLSDGTLQAYYDSELAAPGRDQYIALKTGLFNASSNQWEWVDERVVNKAGVGGAGVRDGMPIVVNLGPDLDGVGDRLMVVVEGIAVHNGQAHNVIRAFEAQNGGATQADWDGLLDSRVIYQSPVVDPEGHRYNAYAPYAIRVGGGPALVAFSTDEGLYAAALPADQASAPVRERHSEIKFIQTTSNYETWTTRKPLWGTAHSEFEGSIEAGDIRNYQIGMFELSPNDILATLDLFGKQLVFRPALGGHAADFNEDGAVDGADLLIWQRGFGLAQQTTTDTGDANGDGVVDRLDLTKWREQVLAAGAAATALSVAEPSVSWPLATLVITLVTRTARLTTR